MATSHLTRDQLIKKIGELKKEVERLERRNQYQKTAEDLKVVFDSFIDVGFTEDQAIKLTSSMITAAAIQNH